MDSRLLAAHQDRLVLLAARHVDDLAGGKADPAAESEQKGRIVGNCSFRLLL
jgi:hypothetical protein